MQRIKELLTILGSLPIKSKYTRELLIALSKVDKNFNYSKSIEEIVSEIEGTHKIYCDKEVIKLLERIKNETATDL